MKKIKLIFLLVLLVRTTSLLLAQDGNTKSSYESIKQQKILVLGDRGSNTDSETGHPITVGEYCIFLNAVGSTDFNGAYNEKMDFLVRSGLPGHYVYTVVSGEEEKTMSFVDGISAMSYSHWKEQAEGFNVQSSTLNFNSCKAAQDQELYSNHIPCYGINDLLGTALNKKNSGGASKDTGWKKLVEETSILGVVLAGGETRGVTMEEEGESGGVFIAPTSGGLRHTTGVTSKLEKKARGNIKDKLTAEVALETLQERKAAEDTYEVEHENASMANLDLEKEIYDNIYTSCLAKVAAMSLNRSRIAGGELGEEVQKTETWAAAEKEATSNVQRAKRQLDYARRETEKAGKNNPTTSAAYEMKRLAEELAKAKVEMAYATRDAIAVRHSPQSEAAEARITKAKNAVIAASINLQTVLKALKYENITDGEDTYKAAIVAIFSDADALWQEGDQKTTESYNKNATAVEKNAAKNAANAAYAQAEVKERAARETYKNAVMIEANEAANTGEESSIEEWNARVARLEEKAKNTRVAANTTKKPKDRRAAERAEAIAAANKAARDVAWGTTNSSTPSKLGKKITSPPAKTPPLVKNLQPLESSTTSLSPIIAKSNFKKGKERRDPKDSTIPQDETKTEEKQESFVVQFSKEMFKTADEAWGTNSRHCFEAKKALEGPPKVAAEIRRKKSFKEAQDAEATARTACGEAISRELDIIIQTHGSTAQDVWNAIIVEADQAVEQARVEAGEKDSAKNKSALDRAVIVVEAMTAARDVKWPAKTAPARRFQNNQIPSFPPTPPSDNTIVTKGVRTSGKDKTTLQETHAKEEFDSVATIRKKIFKDADDAWWRFEKTNKTDQYNIKFSNSSKYNSALRAAYANSTRAVQKAEAFARTAYLSVVMAQAAELVRTKGPSAQELWKFRVAQAELALSQAQTRKEVNAVHPNHMDDNMPLRAELIVAAEQAALNAIAVEIRAEMAFSNAETVQTESAWIDAKNNAQAAEAIWNWNQYVKEVTVKPPSQQTRQLKRTADDEEASSSEKEINVFNLLRYQQSDSTQSVPPQEVGSERLLKEQKAKWTQKTALANFKMLSIKKDRVCAEAERASAITLASIREAEIAQTEAAWTIVLNHAQAANAILDQVIETSEELLLLVSGDEKTRLTSEIEQAKVQSKHYASVYLKTAFVQAERAAKKASDDQTVAEGVKTEATWLTASNSACTAETAWNHVMSAIEALARTATGEEKKDLLTTQVNNASTQRDLWISNIASTKSQFALIVADLAFKQAAAGANIQTADLAKSEASWIAAQEAATSAKSAWEKVISDKKRLTSEIEQAKSQLTTWTKKEKIAQKKLLFVQAKIAWIPFFEALQAYKTNPTVATRDTLLKVAKNAQDALKAAAVDAVDAAADADAAAAYYSSSSSSYFKKAAIALRSGSAADAADAAAAAADAAAAYYSSSSYYSYFKKAAIAWRSGSAADADAADAASSSYFKKAAIAWRSSDWISLMAANALGDAMVAISTDAKDICEADTAKDATSYQQITVAAKVVRKAAYDKALKDDYPGQAVKFASNGNIDPIWQEEANWAAQVAKEATDFAQTLRKKAGIQ